MAERLSLTLEPRTVGRKSLLRQLRLAHKVPGSLYGYGEATSIAADEKALIQLIRSHGAGALVNVRLEGEESFALLKEVDRNPITDQLLHVSLQRVALEEQINTTTSLHIIGADQREDDGGILSPLLSEINVRCRADSIPEFVEADVSGLTIGHGVRVADLVFPEGVEPLNNPDQVVVNVSAPREIEEEEEIEGEEIEGEEIEGEEIEGEAAEGS